MSSENLPKPAEPSSVGDEERAHPVAERPDPPALEPELVEYIDKAVRHQTVLMKHEHHSGPMPAPKTFKQYDEVLPGTALLIRDEFQANGMHVRAMEEKALSGQIANDANNRRTAERLVWGSLVLVLVLAVLGHTNVAIAVAITTVSAIITGFLVRKPTEPVRNFVCEA